MFAKFFVRRALLLLTGLFLLTAHSQNSGKDSTEKDPAGKKEEGLPLEPSRKISF